MNALFSALTGWTLFGGIALGVGAVAARWLILPRAFAAGEDSLHIVRVGAARVGMAGSLLMIVGVGFYFIRQLTEFHDPFVPWSEDADFLLGLAWGRTWIRAAVGSVIALVAFTLARRGRSFGWWLATPVMIGLGTFPGFTGHAAAADSFRTLSLLADATHVWAAGAWIGGLAVVLYLERGHRRRSEGQGSLLPALVPAFSPIAMGSVGALVVTGTFAGWAHLPSLGALLASGYGRALLIKLVVVAVVLGMGAKNFRVLTPRLGTADGDDSMRNSATLELIIAQVVLIITAVLIRTSPIEP
jgi:putative copper export protein